MAEMATYVLFMVHTNDNTDDDEEDHDTFESFIVLNGGMAEWRNGGMAEW